MYTQCVALLALYVGLAHCFSWDIVVNGPNGLKFYNNGTLTRSEDIPWTQVYSMAYDPVHNRVLFSDNSGVSVISSFDIATKQIKTLVSCELADDFKFAYDAPSDTFFWSVNPQIYSTSLKPGSNNALCGTPFIDLDETPSGIAVDSCGGYIYWATGRNIQRARFDGSEIEVVVDGTVWLRQDLVIDQQTHKMYWIDKYYDHGRFHTSIESADLNGNNRKTLHSEIMHGSVVSITVSKEFIYLRLWGDNTYWQLPKNPLRDGTEPEKISITDANCYYCDNIAANYQVEDQIEGSRTCDALMSLLPSASSKAPTDASLLCVHGTQVIGESVCNCAQGYTGDRCDVSLCQNYCLHGDCSVSDEQPKCRCNAGYSGERCEVDACQKHCLNGGVCSLNESEPVCLCTEDYKGARCDIPACQDYCFKGNCSIGAEGQPKCRCNAGYFGERCEFIACQGYCLNNGVCSLNADSVPVCHCTGDYEGDRCEVSVSVFFIKCFRIAPTLSTLRDILNIDVAPVTLDKEVLQLMSENCGACSLNEP